MKNIILKNSFILIQKTYATYEELTNKEYYFKECLRKSLDKVLDGPDEWNNHEDNEYYFYTFYLFNPEEKLFLNIDDVILKEKYCLSSEFKINLSQILNLFVEEVSKDCINPFIKNEFSYNHEHELLDIDVILKSFNEEFLNEIKENKIKFIMEKD